MQVKQTTEEIYDKLSKINNPKEQDYLFGELNKTLIGFRNKLDGRPVLCFLSHTWANEQHLFARFLANRLNRYHKIFCWLDEDNLKYGDHIFDKIDRQLTLQTDIVIILLSPEYLQSHNCKTELSKANKLYSAKKILLLPILLSKSDIPLELEGLLFADFTDCLTKANKIKRGPFEKQFKKLVNSILHHTPKPMDLSNLTFC
jgi:TIR domain